MAVKFATMWSQGLRRPASAKISYKYLAILNVVKVSFARDCENSDASFFCCLDRQGGFKSFEIRIAFDGKHLSFERSVSLRSDVGILFMQGLWVVLIEVHHGFMMIICFFSIRFFKKWIYIEHSSF